MIIEEKDFKLTPVSESSLNYDLELLYTIKPKGKEVRQEFKVAAYGVSLESALKKIIQYRLSCKHDVVDLATYLDEFKKELESLKKLVEV